MGAEGREAKDQVMDDDSFSPLTVTQKELKFAGFMKAASKLKPTEPQTVSAFAGIFASAKKIDIPQARDGKKE